MITVTIQKTGVLRKAWRLKVQAGNGAKLPHDYNAKESAVETAELMFGTNEPVTLRVIEDDGTVTNRQLRS